MARIDLGGYEFTIQPDTASWSYSMKVNAIPTYGGRVTQLLACSIDKLSVEGYIRPKRYGDRPDIEQQWQGMREFESNVKDIMAFHEREHEPVQLIFPEVDWGDDNWVYLTGYTDVRYEPSIPAVKYTLKFEVDSGFEGIVPAGGDYGFDNIPDGVGWVRNVYNTPKVADWKTYIKALEDYVDAAGSYDSSEMKDFFDYINEAMEDSDKDNQAAVVQEAANSVKGADGSMLGDAAAKIEAAAEANKTFLQRRGIVAGG